ncbi:hypothetical protein KB816_002965 [Salmonella enterica]|uniref:DUF7181 domain-containing protein n=2 Tax=Kuttervirus TaxID=2169536 RepID=S4TP91_9CAUD|nr:hypothetical protein FDI91_gp165 [Salmonella phage STML-13-1]YP_009966783.1 hypothetical protein HYQ27_gp061 [Salmonella phage Se-J]AGF88486.1 hypothetical protein SP063_00165 [Salmonella phage FSL SP-063]AYC62453.1 hypothetical protein vBEcoMSa157lw_00164 [Escherichia phage vB_EcoM_Sa157lw]EBI9227064.1 hypothetical protein [Salmonella enterica]EDL7894946.1 hypothetical protein [Salmonella enterica subsp. enterica serovar Typhimurium]EDW4918023.1 hypothetical protein [Salmonella enterica s
MTAQKPTYDELAAALIHLDDAFQDLFGQVCSNTVTNAWGKPVNFSVMNKHREQASSTISNLRRTMDAKQPSIQQYLENFDEYSFKDLLFKDLVEQEQRRQSKNCSEVQSSDEIREILEQEFEGTCDPIGLAVMIVKALAYAAKGETDV